MAPIATESSKAVKKTKTKTTKTKKKKQTIPKPLKKKIWNTYIGKEHGIARCFCCRDKEIEKDDFHAGHILAEVNGGTIDLDNLLPICSCCNSSMGSTHMRDFVAKFFKKNLKKFDKRQKALINKKKGFFSFGRG